MVTKVEYINSALEYPKLREALAEVVTDVDALIPQNEDEFMELRKLGLYPTDDCVPFVTKQGTPLACLRDNDGRLDYKLPEDMHLFGEPIINL